MAIYCRPQAVKLLQKNPADKGKAKAYQVRQVLQAIEKLKVNNDLRH